MKIAVHFTEDLPKDSYSHRWIEFLQKENVEVLKLDLRLSSSLEKLNDVDGAMWHWYHLYPDKIVAPRVLNTLSLGLHKHIFPNLESYWHFDDKISQMLLLRSIDAPIVESDVFYNIEAAKQFIDNTTYPFITKLAVGAGSANVYKVDTKEKAIEIVDKLFGSGMYPYSSYEFSAETDTVTMKKRKLDVIKNIVLNRNLKDNFEISKHWYYRLEKDYFYVQKFLDNNEYDIRVTTIGDKAFAFRRFNRDGDFRASGSGKIDYDQDKIPETAIKLALEISKKLGFQSMAYDFLYDGSELKIVEISYAYVNSAVHNCPGYWMSDMSFVEGNIWPEELHVKNFINTIKSSK